MEAAELKPHGTPRVLLIFDNNTKGDDNDQHENCPGNEARMPWRMKALIFDLHDLCFHAGLHVKPLVRYSLGLLALIDSQPSTSSNVIQCFRREAARNLPRILSVTYLRNVMPRKESKYGCLLGKF